MKLRTCTAAFLILFATATYSQDLDTSQTDTVNVQQSIDAGIGLNSQFTIASKRDYGNVQLLQQLQGRVAGLEIMSTSGSPGASISSLIRGHSSVLNNNSPLIVLDGMIIDNSEWGNTLGGTDQSNRLIDINPNDIALVKVLKGSSACALYGIRGSNGVIELTSKTGSEGLKISISSATTFSSAGKLIELQSTNAQGIPGQYRGPQTFNASSWGPSISELEFDGADDYAYDNNGDLVPKGFGNGIAATAYDPYEFLMQGIAQNINVSIANGSEKLKYRISANNNSIGGVIPTSSYRRSSISVNLAYTPITKLTIKAGARYIASSANRTLTGSNIKGIMLGLTRTPPTFDNLNGLSPNDALNNDQAYQLSNGLQRSYRRGIYDNPYWSVNKNPNSQTVRRIIGNIQASYDINSILSVSLFSGTDRYADNRAGGISADPELNIGSAYADDLNYASHYNKLSFLLSRKLNDHITIDGSLGADFYTSNQSEKVGRGTGQIAPDIVSLSNTIDVTLSSSGNSKATAGIFANADIGYSDFLDIGIAVRNDRSSALSKNTSSLWSYGIDASLDIFKLGTEDLNSQFDNRLEFSIAYGRTGNDIPGSINRTTSQPTNISGDGFIVPEFIENQYTLSDIAPNSYLRPETTDAIEFGLQLSQFRNRIQLGINLYSEFTKNVIILSSINEASGYANQLRNEAKISNRGLEASVAINIVNNSNLSWSIGANATRNISKVNLPDFDPDGVFLTGFIAASSYLKDGKPYGAIVGRGYLRNDLGQTIIGSDGYPLVDQNLTVQGDPNPDWLFNISNELSILDKLSISALLEIRKGGDVWCGTCGTLNYLGRTQLAVDEINQTVIFEGINTDGEPNDMEVNLADPNQPLNTYFRYKYGFGGITEQNVHDASWVRLRQVSMQYDLSAYVGKIPGISGMTISLYGENLFLSTKYPGFDPETNLTGTSNGRGIAYYTNPATKSFGMRIYLSL